MGPFWQELKRRNVFKVGVAYAVVAWLLIQAISIILPTFDAPKWITQTLMFVILLGFPLALFLAWAFELTPDGIKPTSAVEPEQSVTPQTGQKLNRFIISTLALILVLVVLDAYVLSDQKNAAEEVATTAPARTASVSATTETDSSADADSAVDESTVAVLPFANISGDKEQEYFSDGLTEELINKLSQVDGLLVSGRNSSFYFKGREDALRDIGQQLGVKHLLQGSVRKSGTQMRVTAQLLNVESNSNLWSQTFDRQLQDIFAIQDEIAMAVTTALSVTLRAGDFSDPGMTGNLDAYDAYMRGQKLLDEAGNGQGSLLDAIPQFEKAVSLDPDFAVCWITLAALYSNNTVLTPSQKADFSGKEQQALAKATALIPDHPYLQLLLTNRKIDGRDFADMEQSLLALLAEGGSTESEASTMYASMLWGFGRPQEALRYAQRAKRLNPLIFGGAFFTANTLINLNRIDEAQNEIEAQLATGRSVLFFSGLKFVIALLRHDKEAALAVLNQYPNFGPTQYTIAQLWEQEGEAAALAELHRLVAAGDMAPITKVVYREWAATLGDPELGLELLRSSDFRPGDIWLPMYSEVRQLPGFKDWLVGTGLVDYWRSTGNWNDYCRPLSGNDDFECD